MKILIVDKPLQNKTSSNLEYVEYREEYNENNGFLELKQYIPEWCVKTDRTTPQLNLKQSNREFIEWLIQKERDIEKRNKQLEEEGSKIRIDGIYLYDIGSMFQGICNGETEVVDAITFNPRYDYIKIAI